MRPGRGMIKIVRCYDLVLYSLVIQKKSMLWTVALEDKKILHNELLVLVPPYSQALVTCTARFAFLELGCIE
jgi:hypothetical protein